MSANRYSECPKCKKEKVDAVAEVRELYGTIPVEDYEIRMALADSIVKENAVSEPPETLREDWELYIRDGVLILSYGASCSSCNFTFGLNKKFKMI